MSQDVQLIPYTLTTPWEKNALIVLKGFLFLCRDLIIKYVKVIAVFILHTVGAILRLHLFAVIDDVSLFFAWHLAKYCFLIWTPQSNLQGKWLSNAIASTLLTSYRIRYPFITYPLSDLSQIIWCLGFTSMKFSEAIAPLAWLLELQCQMASKKTV